MKKIRVSFSDEHAFSSPPITRRLLNQWRNRDPESKTTAAPALPSHQTEVVQLIAKGYSNQQMARWVSASIRTVGKHRQDLMNKLNAHNTVTLTRHAIAEGIIKRGSNLVPLRADHDDGDGGFDCRLDAA